MANIDFVVGVCLLIGLSTGQGAAVPDPKQPEGSVTELDSAAHPEFGQPPEIPFAQDVADPLQPEGRVTGLYSAAHPDFGQPPQIPFVPDPLLPEGRLIELDSAAHPEFGHAPQIPFAVPDPHQPEGRLVKLDSAAHPEFGHAPQIPFGFPDSLLPEGRLIELDSAAHPEFGHAPQIPFGVPDPLQPERRLIELDSTSHPGFGHAPQIPFEFGVAFTVKSPTDFNGCFIYQEVVTNIGHAYDPGSGYFTAQIPGVYYFSFTSLVWTTYGAALYRNGQEIVNTYSPHFLFPMSGTNSAVLWLQEGDRVNICGQGNKFNNNGNRFSTFSGFLLYPRLLL